MILLGFRGNTIFSGYVAETNTVLRNRDDKFNAVIGYTAGYDLDAHKRRSGNYTTVTIVVVLHPPCSFQPCLISNIIRSQCAPDIMSIFIYLYSVTLISLVHFGPF